MSEFTDVHNINPSLFTFLQFGSCSHGLALITCQIPDSSGTYTINYRTCLCKQVKNKVIYWQCWKGHEIEPTWSHVSRLRYTNDFMTSVYSFRGHNSENMHKVIFKWERATGNDFTCFNTNNLSIWAEKTYYSVVVKKYYLENSHWAKE